VFGMGAIRNYESCIFKPIEMPCYGRRRFFCAFTISLKVH
jgi:hypothetical protein